MTRPPSVPRSPRPEVSQGRAGGPGLPSAPRGLGTVSSRRRSRLCVFLQRSPSGRRSHPASALRSSCFPPSPSPPTGRLRFTRSPLPRGRADPSVRARSAQRRPLAGRPAEPPVLPGRAGAGSPRFSRSFPFLRLAFPLCPCVCGRGGASLLGARARASRRFPGS